MTVQSSSAPALRRDDAPPRVPGPTALAELGITISFPALVIGTTLVQQPEAALVAVGQVLVWSSLLAAGYLGLSVLGAERTVFLLVLILMASRAGRAVLGPSGDLLAIYEVAVSALFVLGAAAIVWARPDLLHRQIKWFMACSVPLMLLQLLGVSWAHALRTDQHGGSGNVLLAALGADEGFFGYETIQARPAGLVFANNYLSILIVFAAAIHFGLRRGRRLDGADWALAFVMVLSMSKLVALALVVLALAHIWTGTPEDRARTMRFVGLVAVMLVGYAQAFPDLFRQNTAAAAALANLMIRLADLRAALSGVPFTEIVVPVVGGNTTLLTIEAGSQSGYSAIAGVLPFVLAVGLLALPSIVRAFRVFRVRCPDLYRVARDGTLVFVLMPVITSFLSSATLWFAAGPALLPIVHRAYGLAERPRSPTTRP